MSCPKHVSVSKRFVASASPGLDFGIRAPASEIYQNPIKYLSESTICGPGAFRAGFRDPTALSEIYQNLIGMSASDVFAQVDMYISSISCAQARSRTNHCSAIGRNMYNKPLFCDMFSEFLDSCLCS